jgi:phage repressor protein C with HTH and peptisase S24 domain
MDLTLDQRVKLARTRKKVSQEELAKTVGVSRVAVTAWESGDTKSINSKHLHKAASFLEVDANWLATGEGSMALADDGVSAEEFLEVRVLTLKADAGQGYLPGYIEVKGGHAYRRSELAALHVKPEDAFRLMIDNDSMRPTLYHGDWVLVDGGKKEIRSEGVFVFQVRDQIRVKRFRWTTDGSLEIISDNPDKARYPTEIFTAEQADAAQAKILGRVVDKSGTGGL